MKRNLTRVWKVKLKLAREQQRQWTRAYVRAEQALRRVGAEIKQLEEKIEAAESQLANAE